MWYNIFVSELFFKLSLFGMLLYKIIGWTRNRLYPFLQAYLLDEKKHITEVVEKEHLLTSTRQKLEAQIFNQKQLFTLLEKNVQSWHSMLRDEANQRQTEAKIQQEKMLSKQRLTLEHKNFELAAAAVIPVALQQAEEKLITMYAHDHGSTLLNKLITTLPEATAPKLKAKI